MSGAPAKPVDAVLIGSSRTMPSGVACDAMLEVGNLIGASAFAPANPTPAISNVPFTSGPAAGGNNLVLVGSNFLGTTVSIAGTPMTITTQSATVIFATVPPGSVGPATVVVQNANGCQTTTTYTYL